MDTTWTDHLEASIALREALHTDAGVAAWVDRVTDLLVRTLSAEGAVYTCGNGGSAADALHVAGELSGRFHIDRPALNAEFLNPNPVALTAMANDYSFDEVFSRMVGGRMRAGDVLWAFSTSGNSPNVVEALRAAPDRGVHSILITGRWGGRGAELADHCLRIPSDDVPHIQEASMMVAHVVCARVELILFGSD